MEDQKLDINWQKKNKLKKHFTKVYQNIQKVAWPY